MDNESRNREKKGGRDRQIAQWVVVVARMVAANALAAVSMLLLLGAPEEGRWSGAALLAALVVMKAAGALLAWLSWKMVERLRHKGFLTSVEWLMREEDEPWR